MPQSTSPEYKEESKDESKEKVDYEHYASYKFNEEQKTWAEFPIFVTNLEYGNIRVKK